MENKSGYLHDDLEELFSSYYSISAMVRSQGILSLENVINTVESVPILFKLGVELICMGYEEKSLRRILDRVVFNTPLSTEERKVAEVMIVGLLCIRKGEEPSKIMSKMARALGGIKIFKYAGIKSREEPSNLILFGEPFNFSKSSPYRRHSAIVQSVKAIELSYEKLIVSFLNCNELARREGLYKVHEVLRNAPDTPQMLNEILTYAVRHKDFEALPKIVERVLSKKRVKTLEEAIINDGIEVLFEGVHNGYLLGSIASLFGLESYYDVLAIQKVNTLGESYYFGSNYTHLVQNKPSELREEAIVYSNWGEIASGYEDFELSLSVVALSELVAQYECIDQLMPCLISVELMASAIHVLDSDYLAAVFRHKVHCEVYGELKRAYEKDMNEKEIHVRNANYLAELMMGGDGEAYR